ncbi:hypothetical protein P692DRAFT_20749369, partial [Suillus brevipes Sb2]
ALFSIVHLKQPFGAFLLGRQCNDKFKRVASDPGITAQVKGKTSAGNTMDTRVLGLYEVF